MLAVLAVARVGDRVAAKVLAPGPILQQAAMSSDRGARNIAGAEEDHPVNGGPWLCARITPLCSR